MGWHETEGGLCVPDERLWTHGDCADTFDERLDGAGVVDGDVGQFVNHDLPLVAVGSPTATDRMGWAPLDELPAGAIVLDLNDSDIAAGIAEGLGHVHPAVGPQLDITGTITTGRPTPWVDRSGQAVTMSRFAAGAYLRTALGVSLDPTDAQHVLILFTGSPRWVGGAGISIGATTRPYAGGARGFTFLPTYSSPVRLVTEGGAVVTSMGTGTTIGTMMLGHGLIVRGGNQTVGINGAIEDTDATAAGTLAAGARFTIGASIDGSTAAGLAVSRMVIAYGTTLDAIVTAGWLRRLAECALVIRPAMTLQPGTPNTYARNAVRCCYPAGPAGIVHFVSNNCPPAEASTGLGADEQIVSVTSKNCSFINGDGTTYLADRDAGLTITANPVDDTANLADVAPDCAGLVLAVQNPTGGPLVQRLGNAIGGAPETSWASIRCRVYAGAGTPRLGFMTAAGAFTSIGNVAANYARTSGTVMPGAATDKLAIEIPAGASVYIVLWCAGRGLGTRIPDEVPSRAAAGASATVAMGTLTTTETPSSLEGSVELYITPRGWSGAGAGTPGFLYLSGGGGAVVYVTGGTWRCAIDGTTAIDSGIAPVDGVEHHIRLRWKTGSGMSMTVRLASTEAVLARVDAAYDGSLQAAGTWQLANNGGSAKVRGFMAKRNGGG